MKKQHDELAANIGGGERRPCRAERRGQKRGDEKRKREKTRQNEAAICSKPMKEPESNGRNANKTRGRCQKRKRTWDLSRGEGQRD